MAHFAEIDGNNIVMRVIVISNDVTTISNPQGTEVEQLGIDFCKNLYGKNTKWKQTSYNTKKGVHSHGKLQNRKNYAGIGFKYDAGRNAFIPPSPFLSWVLNEDSCVYDGPTPQPADGKNYKWDEDSLSWIKQ